MANVYRYTNPYTAFSKVAGDLATIAAGDIKNVWGTNSAGDIFRYDLNSEIFKHVAVGQKLAHIAVGKEVWGLDSSHVPYKWDGVSKFVKVPGTISFIAVPMNSGAPWGLHGTTIYRYSPSSKAFEAIKGIYTFLSVGYDSDDAWALDGNGVPWMWSPSSKQFVRNNDESLRLGFVSPGVSKIYGISLSGRIYRTSLDKLNTPHFEDGLINTSGRLAILDASYLAWTDDLKGTQGGPLDSIWGLNGGGQAWELVSNEWKHRAVATGAVKFSKLAVGFGIGKLGTAGDGKTPQEHDTLNVWALGA